MKKITKVYILILSLIIVICSSFIPNIGVRTEGDYQFFGFPAEWLGLYGKGDFSFKVLGLLFNVAVFYVLCLLVAKIIKRFIVTNKQDDNN